MHTIRKAFPIVQLLLCASVLGVAGPGCTGPLDSFEADGGFNYPDAHAPADASTGQDASPPVDASTDPGDLVVRLLDLEGQPVTDATVLVDNVALGTTDASGFFCIQDIPSGQNLRVHTMSEGCSTAARHVWVAPNSVTSLSLSCMGLRVVPLTDATLGGLVQGPDGFELELPPDSLYLEGAPVSGPVDVRYALVNSATAMAAAPGDMLALEGGSGETQLESFGMVDVSFYQGGQRLTFDSFSEAVLSFPLTDTASYTHGLNLGLYTFDEQEGYWLREGMGTVDTQTTGVPVFVAYVTHFSWWNCDEPLADKSCITGRLVDDNGTPLIGASVQGTGVDYLGGSGAFTDSSGSFCVNVKRDSLNDVSSQYYSNGMAHYWIAPNVQAGAAPTDCALGGCVDLGDQVVGSGTALEVCQ